MGAMNGHGQDPLAAAIEAARAQEAQQQVLQQVLNQALQQPAKVVRVTGPNLINVAKDEHGNQILLVALITGERWDIPIEAASARRLSAALAADPVETAKELIDGVSEEAAQAIENARRALGSEAPPE